jgi:hypothetical protein
MQGKIAIRKCEANGSHVDNVVVAVKSDIYILSASVYFGPDCHVTQISIVTVGQVLSERNTSPLFKGELDNDHFALYLS